ncbi:MAG: efflux RND transporter periplasmic adaptor subunit, partial [Emcibacteraceae bacterium]|nr:efflux RND transporter periplasmic adaptor subunit [Emcibacteraceae bacterium]
QVNLDYTRVYAPISGRIGRSMVTEGALVTANQSDSLTTITQLDPIYVDISQPGEQSMRMRSEVAGRTNIPVEIIIDSVLGTTHAQKGELKFSDVLVDETTGSVGLRALIPNPDQLLLPGLFVRAKIELGDRQATLLPQRATTRNPDGSLTVWTIDENNQVNPRPITVNGASKNQWIVATGITAGEKIVIEGYHKIAPGMTVIPSPWVAQ